MFTFPRRLINDPKSMQHEWQKDHMYAERGPWVTHVPTLSIITLQNMVPNVRNEDGNNLVSFYVHVIIAIKCVHYTIIVCNYHTLNISLVKKLHLKAASMHISGNNSICKFVYSKLFSYFVQAKSQQFPLFTVTYF